MRHSNQIGIFWQVEISAIKPVHVREDENIVTYTMYK